MSPMAYPVAVAEAVPRTRTRGAELGRTLVAVVYA